MSSQQTLKLSQAMRAGATKRPDQSHGEYIDCHGASCALGAAFEAAHGEVPPHWANRSIHDRLVATWPELIATKALHPEDGMEYQLFAIIVDLNDCRYWSREQIADWVEGLGL